MTEPWAGSEGNIRDGGTPRCPSQLGPGVSSQLLVPRERRIKQDRAVCREDHAPGRCAARGRED